MKRWEKRWLKKLNSRSDRYNLKSAIVDLAAFSRRRVCSRSKLLQTHCNTENVVKGAIPKGTNLKNFFICLLSYMMRM